LKWTIKSDELAALIESQAFDVLALTVAQISEVAEELMAQRNYAITIQELMSTLTEDEKEQLDYFALKRIKVPGIIKKRNLSILTRQQKKNENLYQFSDQSIYNRVLKQYIGEAWVKWEKKQYEDQTIDQRTNQRI
jgi:glycerol-3-phosphate responsive antiterminator